MLRYLLNIALLLLVARFPCSAQSELSYYHALDFSLSTAAIDRLLATADSLYNREMYETAFSHFEQAKTKSERLAYPKGWIEAAIGMGNVYTKQGNYIKANQWMEQILPYCREQDHTTAYLSELYNRIAVNYGNIGMHKEAIQNLNKAVTNAEKYPDSKTVPAFIYNNIAMEYGVMDMPDKAFAYLRKVDSLLKVKPDASLRVRNYWAYAYMYDKRKDYEQSRYYLHAILRLADSLEDKVTKFLASWKLTDIALRQGDLKAAELYLEQIPDASYLEPMLRNRKHSIAGAVYMYKKDYTKAIAEYQQELAIVTRSHLLPDRIIAHSGLAQAQAAVGNYKLAYEHERKAKELKDSFNKEEQVKNIAITEARYNTAHKDKELAEKKLYINRQDNSLKLRNIGIAVSLFTALLFLTLFLIVRRSYQQKQTRKDEKMKLIVKEKELDEMKALMEGEEQERSRIARDIHDGLMIQFSTVKMNLSAALSKNAQVGPYLNQLDKAIASLRSTAHNLMPDALLEGGLAEAVYYFCENIKEQVDFEITFNLLDEIPRFEEKFELSVYRMVQELMQNIIKHASASEAYIQISYRDGLLNITIEDDGIGMGKIQRDAKDGLGLKSIKNRMPALNGTMEITGDQDAGTSIILEFVVTQMSREAENKII